MKNVFNIALIALIFQACGTEKGISNEQQNTMNNQFKFEIEIIDNAMPSPTPSENMYAIVKLSPHSGEFASNWKLEKIEINGKVYTSIDDKEYKGKGLQQYRTSVREIPQSIEKPYKGSVLFKNEDGERLTYSFNDISVQKVF